MKNYKSKHGFYAILSIVGIVCISFILILNLWNTTTEREQKRSRTRVLEVVKALEANMSYEDVYQVFKEHKWSSFSEDNGVVNLWTKPQPLATNWIIRLLFEDGALVAIKFGTAEDVSKRPKDAPPDIIFRE